jgi:hypothetical protein
MIARNRYIFLMIRRCVHNKSLSENLVDIEKSEPDALLGAKHEWHCTPWMKAQFSSGTVEFFAILPRALAIGNDFEDLPWLKSRTFLASSN